MFFMTLLSLWFLNNWLPTIMNDAGIRIETASLITSLFQIGGLIGSLLLAGFWGRRLSFGLLASMYLAAAGFILLIGEAGAAIPLLVIAAFSSGRVVIRRPNPAGTPAPGLFSAPVLPAPGRLGP